MRNNRTSRLIRNGGVRTHWIVGVGRRRVRRTVLADLVLTLAASPRDLLRAEGLPAYSAVIAAARLAGLGLSGTSEPTFWNSIEAPS